MRKKAVRFSINLIRFSLSSRLAFMLTVEIVASALISLLALSLFLIIGDVVLDKPVLQTDTSIDTFFYSLRNPAITPIMFAFTFLASPIFVFIGSIMIMLYLYIKRRKDAIIFSAILYSGILVNLLLKDLFHRPRPPLAHRFVNEYTYSFPSGHAMNAFVFYTAFTYFVFRETRNCKLTIVLAMLSAVLISCVGISRIYLGAHYASDVVAGYIAGCLWFIAAILFEKTIIFERLYRNIKRNGKR